MGKRYFKLTAYHSNFTTQRLTRNYEHKKARTPPLSCRVEGNRKWTTCHHAKELLLPQEALLHINSHRFAPLQWYLAWASQHPENYAAQKWLASTSLAASSALLCTSLCPLLWPQVESRHHMKHTLAIWWYTLVFTPVRCVWLQGLHSFTDAYRIF